MSDTLTLNPAALSLPDVRARSTATASCRWVICCATLLFGLALLPRLLGLSEVTTTDEDQWVLRSASFVRALGQGDWRATYQSGHPGVTVMWITTLAAGPDRLSPMAQVLQRDRPVAESPDFLPALAAARLAFAVLSATLVTACGLLSIRLFGWGPGVLAALLLASDPYWSAMSPLLGMDSLLTGLLTASLLTALLAFRPPSFSENGRVAAPARRWPWALLSGLLAGLALLTKSPALLLVPVVLLMAGAAIWSSRPLPRGVRAVLVALVLWAGGVVLVALLWPALLIDPLTTLERVTRYTSNLGLMERDVNRGPLFYPVALALRLGPAVLPGLLALLLLAPAAARRWPSLGVILFVLIFGLGISLGSKKMDRYVLPLFPALTILAAAGWYVGLERLRQRSRRALVMPVGVVTVLLLQLLPLISSWSNPLASYNPLLGGASTAERLIPIGWGEGLGPIATYLRQQPDAEHRSVGIWNAMAENLQAHVPGPVVGISVSNRGLVNNERAYDQLDYYVDYVFARQQNMTPRELARSRPELVSTINGVEYARLYRLK